MAVSLEEMREMRKEGMDLVRKWRGRNLPWHYIKLRLSAMEREVILERDRERREDREKRAKEFADNKEEAGVGVGVPEGVDAGVESEEGQTIGG